MKASLKNAYEKGCCTHYTETLIHATRSRRSGKYTQGRSTSFFQVLQRFTFLLSLMLYKKSSDEITSKNMSLPCAYHQYSNYVSSTHIHICIKQCGVRGVRRGQERESKIREFGQVNIS